MLLRTFSHLFVFIMVFALAGAAHADGADFLGEWDVNTRLTAASDAVNPNYRVGDLRTDVWRISGSVAQPSLTTRDGTLQGRIVGGQAEFLAEIALGAIIVMRVQIGAFQTSSRSMSGTIRAEYWDRRFGYMVGLDAWTFEAFRRQ